MCRRRGGASGPAVAMFRRCEVIDDEPITRLKTGDTFYEPSGCIHRNARNPSDKNENSPARGSPRPARRNDCDVVDESESLVRTCEH